MFGGRGRGSADMVDNWVGGLDFMVGGIDRDMLQWSAWSATVKFRVV